MITTPAPIAATRICGVISGPSSVTPPAVRSQAAATCASSTPAAAPSAEPSTPSSAPWVTTTSTTCDRVAPAARSSPSSRTRSITVIASVLRITNAAANRLIAASSAIVERMSAVDARSDSATSWGDDST